MFPPVQDTVLAVTISLPRLMLLHLHCPRRRPVWLLVQHRMHFIAHLILHLRNFSARPVIRTLTRLPRIHSRVPPPHLADQLSHWI